MKDRNTEETNKYQHELAAPLPERVHMVMPSWEKGKEKTRLVKRNSGKKKKKNRATMKFES